MVYIKSKTKFKQAKWNVTEKLNCFDSIKVTIFSVYDWEFIFIMSFDIDNGVLNSAFNNFYLEIDQNSMWKWQYIYQKSSIFIDKTEMFHYECVEMT